MTMDYYKVEVFSDDEILPKTVFVEQYQLICPKQFATNISRQF